jgi:hypothetical protein
LAHGGATYTTKDAISIMDQCAMVMQLPTASFVGSGMGVVVGEGIERRGLNLDWPANPGSRKATWARECASFEQAFNDKAQWANLDKWPD